MMMRTATSRRVGAEGLGRGCWEVGDGGMEAHCCYGSAQRLGQGCWKRIEGWC